ARLNRLNSTSPIRSRAAEEGSFQIPIWGVPFLLLFLYVCLFSGLNALGVAGPDEPRYAAIARAMAATGDWITPRLWGSPWFEKPVLYYWGAGIAMRIFGVGEFAARLPSAMAALLAVIAVAWTALRSYGIAAAWFSLLMLPTSVAVIAFSRAASPDMLFAGFLTAAMAVASEMLQKPRPGNVLRVAFGFFLGAAVLAKGPAAVILAGGATLLWAALSRQGTAPFRFLHPLVIAVFCVTALPWYVLCAMRNPGFLNVFIWQHNFQRYLTPVFEHRQPFWFFGAVFLVAIIPWLPFLISSISDSNTRLRSPEWRDSPALFIGCWSLFTLVFFSLSQSKLPGYILPAIPPAVLLLAVSTAGRVQQKSSTLSRLIISVGLLFPIGIAVALVEWNHAANIESQLQSHIARGFQIALGTAIVLTVVVVIYALRPKLNEAIFVAASTTALLVLLANRLILPGVDTLVTPRAAAMWAIQTHSLTAEDAAVYGLPRAYGYGLNYYFNATLPDWMPENTDAKILFCGREALNSPQLESLRGKAKFPATGDGKVFLVLLGSD
ncbi:MAG TPA: glycosyltransferase family 39 protein, partial [Candidatus Acidoferrales bacterium]|nr:glycosyltransferase family 39 protein [Candidatus Acidoferrales bacterium]